MEEGLEKFLEVEEANVHNLDIQVLQINLQLALELLVFHVLDVVVLELLAEESIFLHNFDVVDRLLLHAGYSPQLVAIWVLRVKVPVT
jgi:hypothetical protein